MTSKQQQATFPDAGTIKTSISTNKNDPNYAKRQRTWFRSNQQINWMTPKTNFNLILDKVKYPR